MACIDITETYGGITMPRAIADIFNVNPDVEVIEVVGYEDDEPFGLSSGGRILKILDADFARKLAELPDASTETGHISDKGYCIHGCYRTHDDSFKAFVHRLLPVAHKKR